MLKARYLVIAILLIGMSISSCKCSCSENRPPVEEKPKPNIQAKPPVVASPKATATSIPGPTPWEPAADKPPLPDDFPKEIPVMEGAAVERVQPLANDAKNVIFVSDKSVPEITNFYRKKLEGSGWKMTQNSERPNHAFIAFKKGEIVTNIQVVEDARFPGKHLIAIMYENEKKLPFDEF